jgi:hypothetical protein
MRTAISHLVALAAGVWCAACATDTSGTDTTGAGTTGAQLDAFCWNDNFPSSCDPRSDVPCAAGASCTINYNPDIAVACDGPPANGDLGSPCDAASGCKPTLLCQLGVCETACCSDAECPPGGWCNILHGQLGTLGTCGQ